MHTTRRTFPPAKAFPGMKSCGNVMLFFRERSRTGCNRAVHARRVRVEWCDAGVRAGCSAPGYRQWPMAKGKIFHREGRDEIPPPESVQMRFAAACRCSGCTYVSEPVRC